MERLSFMRPMLPASRCTAECCKLTMPQSNFRMGWSGSASDLAALPVRIHDRLGRFKRLESQTAADSHYVGLMRVASFFRYPCFLYSRPAVVSASLMKSRIDTIRELPKCPRRSKSLSSLTMKSDLAVAAHSRMRSSSESSLTTCSVSVGET